MMRLFQKDMQDYNNLRFIEIFFQLVGITFNVLVKFERDKSIRADSATTSS